MGDMRDWSETMELHLRSVKAELEHSGVRSSWLGFPRQNGVFFLFLPRCASAFEHAGCDVWGCVGRMIICCLPVTFDY